MEKKEELKELIKEGEELVKARPDGDSFNFDEIEKQREDESKCYEWFVKAQEVIKNIFGENSRHYETFVAEYKVIEIRPAFRAGGVTEITFLKSDMQKQVAHLKAILKIIEGDSSKIVVRSKVDETIFHTEVIRHGESLLAESQNDPSKRTSAVKECLTAFDAFIKKISGIDDTGSPLMGDAFGFEQHNNANGVIKIDRYPEVQVSGLTTESGRNIQNGVKFMAMGVMLGVRNIAIHNTAKDNILEADEMLHILAVVSFLWRIVDRGVVEALAGTTEFQEANSVAKTFGRMREYYHTIHSNYPTVGQKNMLLKSCLINNNLINGFTCKPIICSFLNEEKEFISSSQCELTTDEKETLGKLFRLKVGS